jgi:hypothetical protein
MRFRFESIPAGMFCTVQFAATINRRDRAEAAHVSSASSFVNVDAIRQWYRLTDDSDRDVLMMYAFILTGAVILGHRDVDVSQLHLELLR